METTGTLYIVATPIGNLEDLTLRAQKIFEAVDLIVCEDTRKTAVLLSHFKIKKPLISYHQHSRLCKIQLLINKLIEGKDIALATDAGTPGVADPAGVLIKEALKVNIKVVPIPGPSALTAILSIAGLPTERFLFLGYLPKKKGRSGLFKIISQSRLPIVIFESPVRIVKTLNQFKEILGQREIIVGRELTKKFEQIYRGNAAQIISEIRPQGEMVILIAPVSKKPEI